MARPPGLPRSAHGAQCAHTQLSQPGQNPQDVDRRQRLEVFWETSVDLLLFWRKSMDLHRYILVYFWRQKIPHSQAAKVDLGSIGEIIRGAESCLKYSRVNRPI